MDPITDEILVGEEDCIGCQEGEESCFDAGGCSSGDVGWDTAEVFGIFWVEGVVVGVDPAGPSTCEGGGEDSLVVGGVAGASSPHSHFATAKRVRADLVTVQFSLKVKDVLKYSD